MFFGWFVFLCSFPLLLVFCFLFVCIACSLEMFAFLGFFSWFVFVFLVSGLCLVYFGGVMLKFLVIFGFVLFAAFGFIV